ncbi:putative brtn [Fusarium flagelliforme]|uniref:Putative brtn n=1 Tax=Fusarium flagelliforme TaxID=2675880 RepID=A0A395M7R3_9HYPO|nr:putative brtn [Fusarium flagelliforme]
MSSRVSKRVNRPRVVAERREDISNLIHKFGFEMPRCSACFRANHPQCIVSKGKQHCDFCVSKKYTNCDFGGVTSQAFARVSREKDRIDEQKEQAEADLQDALARLQRLRRQEKHLREKAAEMVRRGCEDLDELEELEHRESVDRQAAEQSALNEIQLLEDHGVINWSAVPDSFFLGVDGGNSSGVVGP